MNFLHKLRDQAKFDNLEALPQIACDVAMPGLSRAAARILALGRTRTILNRMS